MRRLYLWLLLAITGTLLTAGPASAQGQVRFVVNRDNVNIRLYPAIGAEVVGFANAGTVFIANGRSPDNEFLRVPFNGGEGFIGVAVITILDGDINSLVESDPRFIPFGGLGAPRAGRTNATSDISARLPTSGVRVRSGPTTAYRVLADAPRYTVMPLLGRTADNQWVQVNFEGTLGWITASVIEIQGNRAITELPVNGIVASQLPLEFDPSDELFGTLRLMRERIDLAQPSLDQQRATWTEAALGVTPPCGGYPARPSNFSLPPDIRARYNATLDPLIRDFDRAMGALRNAIDLQIETCQRGGASFALTSAPVVTGGLEQINVADSLFASLRRRIDELLPEIGPDDCVFAFGGRVDILPITNFGTIVEGELPLDDGSLALAYCFDVSQIAIGRVEFIRTGANYDVLVAVTPLDNPTDFLVTGSSGGTTDSTGVIISPIEFVIEQPQRYLLIISFIPDREDEPPEGKFAFLLEDITGGVPVAAILAFDENQNVVRFTSETTAPVTDGVAADAGTGQTAQATSAPNVATDIDGLAVFAFSDRGAPILGTIQDGETVEILNTVFGWSQVQLLNGVVGWVPTEDLTGAEVPTLLQPTATVPVVCPGVTLTCDELFNCGEVQACVQAGSNALDPNGNGVACDSTEGRNPLSCTVPATP